MRARLERQRVGREQAPGARLPVEVDARVVGRAVDGAAGQAAVAERADARDAAIGIDEAELRTLREMDVAGVERGAGDEQVGMPGQTLLPRELAGERRSSAAASRCVLITPVHFSPGSSFSSALAMQRHCGNGVLAALAPLVGKPV